MGGSKRVRISPVSRPRPLLVKVSRTSYSRGATRATHDQGLRCDIDRCDPLPVLPVLEIASTYRCSFINVSAAQGGRLTQLTSLHICSDRDYTTY